VKITRNWENYLGENLCGVIDTCLAQIVKIRKKGFFGRFGATIKNMRKIFVVFATTRRVIQIFAKHIMMKNLVPSIRSIMLAFHIGEVITGNPRKE
jgi:hypothetical protein